MEMTIHTKEFVRNPSKWFNKSSGDKIGIKIIRARGEDMVMLSESEYRSMQETAYLLQNPANAEHLLRGVEQTANNPEIGVALTDIDALWK
jgi:antitoxin YefM